MKKSVAKDQDVKDSNARPACRLIPLCPKVEPVQHNTDILLVKTGLIMLRALLGFVDLSVEDRESADRFYREAVEALERLKP